MLNLVERPKTGKGYNRKIKVKGLIPGVVYGKGIKHPIAVEFSSGELVKALKTPKKYNTIIDVALKTVSGKTQKSRVILKELQKHPFREELRHADFYVFNEDKEEVFRVPFRITGRAAGVVAGGKVKIAMKRLKITAKPQDVPAEIVYDVTKMERGDVVRVGDITYPEGVKPLYDSRQALVSITALKLGPGGRGGNEEGALDLSDFE